MKQRDPALHMFQQSITKYIDDSGISKFNIDKDRLREMFENVYTYFQKGGTSSSLYFGTYKYGKLQEQLFRDMISCLLSVVNSIRTWCKSKTGHSQKFISVCQDIVDSKKCELLGISLKWTKVTLHLSRIYQHSHNKIS